MAKTTKTTTVKTTKKLVTKPVKVAPKLPPVPKKK